MAHAPPRSRASLPSILLPWLLAGGLLLAGCGDRGPKEGVLRLGHFPNVTHAQALVAHHLSRQGKGWFESRLGVKVEWYVFNAGPSAMEALLAGTLDATFVGPNPAINAHVRSGGKDVRVLAGAAYGGSALVVRPDAGISGPADFRGRRVLTPQIGNTQDVECRAWLGKQGYRVTTTGGDVLVVPTPNPQHLGEFLQKRADASWTVEPWVSRLEREAGGRVLVLRRDGITTVLASSRAFLGGQRPLARALVAAHEELTRWIAEHADEARAMAKAEIEAITRQTIDDELLARAWPRLDLRADVAREAFDAFVADAKAAGVLEGDADVSALVERP